PRDRLDPRARDNLLAAVPDLWAERFVRADAPAAAGAAAGDPGFWLTRKGLLLRSGLDDPERTLILTRPDGRPPTPLLPHAPPPAGEAAPRAGPKGPAPTPPGQAPGHARRRERRPRGVPLRQAPEQRPGLRDQGRQAQGRLRRPGHPARPPGRPLQHRRRPAP